MYYLSQPLTLKTEKGEFPNIRYFKFPCPCRENNIIFVTEGPHFNASEGNRCNVWSYSIEGDKISITPSIGLNKLDGHGDACHLVITSVPFEYYIE